MPEHLRALVFILVMSGGVFVLARKPATEVAIADADFVRRRNLWFGVTLIAFLAHSYWIFVLVSGLMLLVARRKESNVIALFVWLLFAVPAFRVDIPAFGGIRYLMTLDYLRLLSIVLLVPAYFNLRTQARVRRGSWLASDYFVAGYLFIQWGLQIQSDTVTNTLRYVVHAILDIVLPYYVASRALRELGAFRDVAISFVMAATVLAVLAMYEGATNWTLYGRLQSVLGASWGYGGKLGRSGWLRAASTTGHPIALGYVMVVAISLHAYLRRSIRNQSLWWLGFAVLSGGLLASVSRGPWVGVAGALLVYRLAGPKAIGGGLKAALAVGTIAALVLASPIGSSVIDLLPFVGTVEAQNVDYRQRLMQVAISLILQDPWFGVPGYYNLLVANDLVIGGMVDIVNTYVGIGLANGVIALACFAGAFVVVAINAYAAMRRLPDPESELRTLGCAVLACLAGTVITIFTTSSITVIPVVYWVVVGLGAGYVAMLNDQREGEPVTDPPTNLSSNRARQARKPGIRIQ